MSNILLPLQASQWPQGLCPATNQEWLTTIADHLKAVLPSSQTFYNYGDTVPAPEFQGYPWLYSPEMRWYKFIGNWVSPNLADANERRIYAGALGAGGLDNYDGGAPGAVTPLSGPMWEVDADFTGRTPVGVGLVPGTTLPAVTATVGDPLGNGEHTLTDAEGAVGVHEHPFGISNPASDDAFFAKKGVNTVGPWTGYYITGSSKNIQAPQTTADLFTLPAGAAGAGVVPKPFSVVQPGVGVYFIKRTARIYYKL